MPTTIIRPLTLAWVTRHLRDGEQVIAAEPLHGGITAEMRKLTIATPNGTAPPRALVLRSYVDPYYLSNAPASLAAEADVLTLLTHHPGVAAPELVAVDPNAAECEYPSLLMTHLPGRTVLADDTVETRVPLLARQLATIHAVQPPEQLRDYTTLTTPDTVVIPTDADATAWATAIDAIRTPPPPYEPRFLHRDFQPGNVLFNTRITGVVDWAGACRGPADLDVAHCCTNLALLHGPDWGLRFAEAYEQAGGRLAPAAGDRLYWLVRDALACSEEVQAVARPWREAGRPELTTQAVEQRLDAYIKTLLHAFT